MRVSTHLPTWSCLHQFFPLRMCSTLFSFNNYWSQLGFFLSVLFSRCKQDIWARGATFSSQFQRLYCHGFISEAFARGSPMFERSFERQIWNATFRKQNHPAPQALIRMMLCLGATPPTRRPLCAKTSVFSCGCQCLARKGKQEKVKNLPSDKLGNRHRVQEVTEKRKEKRRKDFSVPVKNFQCGAATPEKANEKKNDISGSKCTRWSS